MPGRVVRTRGSGARKPRDITTRQVLPGDLACLKDIVARSWKDQGIAHRLERRYGQLGGRSWVEWKWDGIEEACMKRPDRVLVSEVGGEVVGFAMFELDPVRRIGTVGNNAVHPRFRGLGVGRRQQDRILAIFREKGMRFAEVVVGLDEGHATARAMYASAGFEKLADSRHLFMRLGRRRRAKRSPALR